MRKKSICLFLCLIQLVVILSGCNISKGEIDGKPVKTAENYVSSGTVAENGGLRLDWDAERLALLVYRDDSLIWTSMPKEQYLEKLYGGAVMQYIESSLLIEYKTEDGSDLTTVNSYSGAYEYGRTYSYLINGGIRLLYCFDEQCLAVPVDYRLADGYLDVSIDLDGIYESGNEIYKISVLPYASSVTNDAANKMFLPDGSGMIMYCDEERPFRTYSASVYGNDLASTSKYKFTDPQEVKLPVFAVSDNEATYCTIIDKGEECAEINATAGDTDLGFSYAYTSFCVRGAETITLPQGYGKVMVGNQYSALASGEKIGQRIVFIDGSDSNFMTTAEIYRDYLKEEKGLEESDEESAVYLDLPMAVSQREFFLGIPKKVVKSVTTYTQAADIIKDVAGFTDGSLTVRLSGVQSGGLDYTKIAGGYKTENKLGSKKELAELLSEAKEINTKIYPDFDISRFTKSGSGFRLNKSSATNATSLKASQYFYSVSTGGLVQNAYEYYLLAPNNFLSAAEKLSDTLSNKGFDAVSLSSVGNVYYSDYRKTENYVGLNYSENVEKVNSLYKESDISLMYDSANQYAAVGADCIINSPVNSSDYTVEDEWIPFYQIVFKGYVPMSGASLTLSDNARRDFLRSIQCGLGLYFTVCGEETSQYSASLFDSLSAGSYNERKETVAKYCEEGKDAFDAVSGANITNFEIISLGVYKTEFSNGIKITVNYNSAPFSMDGITIDAESFIIER